MAVTLKDSVKAVPSRVLHAGPSSSTLHHEPSANTAAVCSLSASDTAADECWVLKSVVFSYDLNPTGGSLTITDGSNVEKIDIATAGYGEWVFDPPKKFAADTAVTITLAAGGAGVSGICNARNSWIEKA